MLFSIVLTVFSDISIVIHYLKFNNIFILSSQVKMYGGLTLYLRLRLLAKLIHEWIDLNLDYGC